MGDCPFPLLSVVVVPRRQLEALRSAVWRGRGGGSPPPCPLPRVLSVVLYKSIYMSSLDYVCAEFDIDGGYISSGKILDEDLASLPSSGVVSCSLVAEVGAGSQLAVESRCSSAAGLPRGR